MFPLKDENPPKRRPVITWGLIVLNLAIFIGALATGAFKQAILEYGMRPSEVLKGEGLHTLITSMFLHGGFLHIIGNLWYLWIFGDNVEDALGRWKFILFYLFSGVIADVFHILSDPASNIPTIGASGAISGVLGAYLVLYPRAEVHSVVTLGFFWHFVTVPAIAFLGFWFIFQLFLASATWIFAASSSVAYLAHIGGFIAGMILALPMKFRRGHSYSVKFTTYY